MSSPSRSSVSPSSPSPLLCPTCLQLCPAPVALPCGHAFCLRCLRTMDRGLDRHCCPRCRREYRPSYDRDCNDDRNYDGDCNCNDDRNGDKNTAGVKSLTAQDGGEGREENGFIQIFDYSGTNQNINKSNCIGRIDETANIVQNRSVFNINIHQNAQEELEGKGVSGLRNNSPLSTALAPETTKNVQENIEKMQKESVGVQGISGFPSKTSLSGQDWQRGGEIEAGNDIFEMKAGGFEGKGSPAAIDSELYNYLKSKIVEPKFNLPSDVAEDGSETPLLPVSTAEDERKMAESKLKLSSHVSELTEKLEKAETVLKKEREYELNVTAANAKLRENALKLVGEVTSFAQNYSETVMALIEREFSPGEETIRKRVEEASDFSNQIKKTMQEVDDLLKEENAKVFTSKIQSLESEIARCEEAKRAEESPEVNFDLSKLCPELERLNGEFRDKFGRVQRSLRNEFNPSEVTFDPETLHPNLLLSEDLKTVKFSAKKQPYDATPKRFSSFMQVLSAQSFSAGVHRWEVELDGAPWILGVCVASSLPRSGLPSALETLPSSWALMWNQNLLTAFDGSRAAPLKRTSQVSRRMALELDLDRGRLDFYNLSLAGGGRSLIHSFKTESKEPLHLAYRMLSGDANGRLTLCS